MRQLLKTALCLSLVFSSTVGVVHAQEKPFTLQDCITYALENNTNIGMANNAVKSQTSSLEQLRAQRLPNLNLSASENLGTNALYNNATNTWSNDGSATFNASLSSNMTLYNGAKIKNAILQGEIDLSAAETDIKTQEELLSLDVLAAYVSALQAKEQVVNSKAQHEASEKQFEEATIRHEAGVMSPADYLNIKSQLASDKASLASSEGNLRIRMVALMQTMNMDVVDAFDIVQPDSQELVKTNIDTDANSVYNTALGIQPSIKTAELELQSADYNIKIAKGNYMPNLSLSGSVQTRHSSSLGVGFGEQIANQLTPALGLSLSIPIFQRKDAKNSVTQATIARDNYEYTFENIKDNLRKAIEQACTDAQTAQLTYAAYQEQYTSEQESFKLAEEMFAQGLINSIDFNTSKNNLIKAETNLTNAKFTLVLQNEIVEYYLGNKIEL